ncbi:hypothetical protein B0A55_05080 [Friedmanniomyces simplex]|uniref:NADP-dependent oxidoreductase domain-containing protein n=1 Tax=Friedmanniomyces simplex TaxID=329884 RepID=A0A4U0XEE2_9PEZI|nr:hypothetical protein B0A55_05080 [Friedmanniomyces simplex]
MSFGLMNLSLSHYGKLEGDEERFKVLDRALELGATLWDSAKYAVPLEGASWKLVADKFGIKFDLANPMTFHHDSSAKYCREACEKSLGRLGTDYIDLYYVHHVDPEVPIEQTMRALVELKSEGKIRYIGLSNITSATLRRAHKVHPISCVQQEYSPFTRDIETGSSTHLLHTCRELGVAVVCYSPLGRGLLTSTFVAGSFGSDPSDMRSKVFPRLCEDNREVNVKLVGELAKLAERKGCSTSQLALAWLMKQGHDIFPNPGTKRIKYLEENWAALDISLSDEEEQEVRKFVESAEMAGGRLPEKYMNIPGDTKEEEEA